MPGGAVLEIRIDSKLFSAADGRAAPVLRDIRFAAEAGEVLALLAPSGTGKTTTLRIALGLDREFAGAVRRSAGRIGVVFQEPLLLPWLTVAENLKLVVTDSVPPPDIPALLTGVGLPGMGQRLPGELSLGMARRVALARALAVDPGLLVLDEPFASLDPQLGATLAAVVSERARRHGTLVLLATHDLGQALAIADRLLVLSGHPASLAADLAVPGATDRAGRERLREELLGRFEFLRGRG